jgi:serine/threonine protein phosphatase PrpC
MNTAFLKAVSWQPAGMSVVGPAHLRKQLPNQDAIKWWTKPDASIAIMAVADGHGDSRSFRCVDGASFAVQAAIEVLREYFVEADTIADSAAQLLPRELVSRWRRFVEADLDEFPLPINEEDNGDLAPYDPFLPYGTTLLAVAALPRMILTLQIGDGDILIVADDGNVTRPLPRDPRLLANSTTSLCGSNAEADFQAAISPCDSDGPSLILAATDGYSNSFMNDSCFFQVGTDLLALIRSEGMGVIQDNLARWLEETSLHGSGDDTTLGLLWRIDPKGKQQ